MRRTLSLSVISAVIASSALVAAGARSAANPPGGQPGAVSPSALRVSPDRLASGFDSPTAVVTAYDGTNRAFVVERRGTVKLVRGGAVQSRSYLDIRGRVNDSGGEQGLLGMAFAPNFAHARHPRIFLTYTNAAGALVLARARAAKRSSTRINPRTLRTLLTVRHPSEQNHNGGSLTFGSDGMLYLGTGDGGGGGDPFRNAQRLSSRSGKILRLDVMTACGSRRYCVPPSNPFRGSANARLVWARGVRNPWKISTDRSTGDLWVGDVGQDKWEEVNRINRGVSGRNLGWSCREGNQIFNASRCPVSHYVAPVAVLCHPEEVTPCQANRSGESLIGGYVYRGSRYPAMTGTYIFGDFISGNLYAYRSGSMAKVGALGYITSFGERGNGDLLAVTYGGELYSLAGASL